MKTEDILQKYYQRVGAKSEPEQLEAASEFSGVNPTKLKKNPGLLMTLIDVLDRPGNATRALLVGKLGGLKGLIPFAQAIEDLTGFNIAMDDEDRVTGEEVLEAWTGIKDTKGKFDLADVLGFTIEVLADPLWLIGAPGLTKVGKAAKTVKGVVKGAKATGSTASVMTKMAARSFGDDVIRETLKGTITKDTLKAISKHYRKGTPMPSNVSKKVVKAFETLYKAGGGRIPKGTFKAKTWAEQAIAGERAFLSIGLPGMKKPVIKGVKAFEKLDTIATKIRMGPVGKAFLHTAKRVSTAKQEDFYRTARKFADETPAFKTREKFSLLEAHARNLDEASLSKLMNNVEFTGGIARAEKGLAALQTADDIFDGRVAGDIVEVLKDVGVEVDDLAYIPDIIAKQRKLFGDNLNQMRSMKKSLLKDLDAVQIERLENASQGVEDMLSKLYDNEIASGLATPYLKGKYGYTPRYTTGKFQKWLKGKGDMTITHKGHVFSVKHGSQIRRDPYLKKLSRDQIQELFQKQGYKGEVFELPLATVAQRVARGEKTIGAAEAIYQSIKEFGNTKGRGVQVNELFKKLGWNVPKSKAKELGLSSFDNIFLDQDIHNALKTQYVYTKKGTVDKAMKKIIKMFKGLLTLPFPAFHSRNYMTALTMNFMDGVVDPRLYAKSFQLQKAAHSTRKIMKKQGINFAEASKQVKWPKVKTAGGAIPGEVFYYQMDKANMLGTSAGHFASEELPLGGRFLGKTGKPGMKHTVHDDLFKGAMGVENNPRIANVLSKVKGMSLDDSIFNAKKVHFDYSDLSQFEKDVMRDNVFLFWTFARKNLAKQTEYLITKPAKMAIFAKAAGGTPGAEARKDLPKYMQERIDIPLPWQDKEGRDMNIRGLGLPMEEAFGPISSPGSGLLDRASRFLSRQGARMMPHIKAPIELATGKNLYFDRDIKSTGEFVSQALPTSRFVNTIQRFGRDDEPATKAVDILTGIKVSPTYPDFYKYLGKKEVAEARLKQSPNIKRFTRYYAPDKEKLTPGERELLGALHKK